MTIKIPDTCDLCQFVERDDDGELICALYQKEWYPKEVNDFTKPEFCKAKRVEVVE